MATKKINRQSLRKLLLLLSFAAFPISILYLSPGPPLMSLKAGVINLSVIVIIAIFVSGFFFRRAFCGWICPGGGCQLVSGAINNKEFTKKRNDWFRIVLISVWILMMLGTILFRSGIPQLDIDNPGAGKFATSDIRYYLPYIPTVIFMFVFVFIFGRRGFCHRGCWIYPLIAGSTKAGTLIHTPSLHVKIKNGSTCNQCKLCTKNCSMSIDVRTHVLEGKPLPNHCIQCGLCVDQCKNDVLAFTYGFPMQ
jgi:polyferredoxin